MAEFEVWAPGVTRVAVQVAERVHAMRGPDERGWWRAVLEGVGEGAEYGFLVEDDATVLPDPRSLWQPHGVHGLSRRYDQDAFAWSDAGWSAPLLRDAVIYELHVGTFSAAGTFDGVLERLDYLCGLGVTHVELMPVAEFPGAYGWGYDGVSLFAVREQYGGPDGLKRLVDGCHARGMAVLLDVVYNHFGPVGNYANRFGPYHTDGHRTPWGEAMNLEGAGSDEVRRFFFENARMWLREYHVDGLRLDAVHEFVDRSAVHFMEELTTEVAALATELGRRLVLIAESDLNDPRVVKPLDAGGYGMDAQWSDDFHHALFTVLRPEERGVGYYRDFGTMAQLAKALTHGFVYEGEFSVYRGRRHGRGAEGIGGERLLGYIQNHDQVGNRAQGDRLEQVVGMARAKVAAGLVLLAPFVPMLFQGEEFAASSPFLYFADHDDAEMARAVSAGRRREFAAFGWKAEEIPDPEERATYERSKLVWGEVAEGRHAEMLAWYRRLIGLRRGLAALRDGDMAAVRIAYDDAARWLTMERGVVKVLCNLGSATVDLEGMEGGWLVLASRAGVRGVGVDGAAGVVVLPPDSLAVVAKAVVQGGDAMRATAVTG